MPDRIRRIDPWLRLAPIMALIGLLATWLHYAWTGSVLLQVWPRTAGVLVPNVIAALALCVLGLCCLGVYKSATLADSKRIFHSAILVHISLIPALPLSSTDLFSYLAYGELAAHGLDMKVVGPAALAGSSFTSMGQWLDAPSVYGPFADYLMAFVGYIGSWFGSPIWAAGCAYKLIVGAMQLASLFFFYRLASRSSDVAAVRGLALFGLNPLLAWEVTSQGHNDGLIVAGATGFIAAVVYRREASGVISLVLGTLAKYVLAPVLGLSIWATFRERGFKPALALGILALLIVAAFCAPRWTPDATLATWLPQLRPGLIPTFSREPSIFGVFWRIVDALFSPHEGWQAPWFNGYAWFGRLFLLAITVLVLFRVRTSADVPSASFMVLLAILATTNKYAAWYVTWLIPFAAVVPQRRWQNLVLLAITLSAAPAMSVPGLWVVLPLGQMAMLVALVFWMRRPLLDRLAVPDRAGS